MATTNQEKIFIVPAMDGGMQVRSSKFLAVQTELKLGVNIDLQYRLGGIAKALGYDQKGNAIGAASTVLGCGGLNTSGGTDKLVAFLGTDAYVFNSGTSAWDAQSRGYSASQKFETEKFLDQLFVVNGLTDAPENYNGSAWSTSTNVTDMPKAKFIVESNLRLFVFNVNIPIGGNFPSRFMFCNLPKNDAITWGFESGSDGASNSDTSLTSAGSSFIERGIKVGDPVFINTGTDAGEYEVKSFTATVITLTESLTATEANLEFWVGGNWDDCARDNSDVGMGIGKNGGRVLMFKRFSLHRIYIGAEEADDINEQVKGVPGTTSHRSITNIRDWTFYAADSGIWRYNGITSQLMSNAIQEVWDGVTAANKLVITGWSVDDRVLKMYVGDVNNTATDLTISKCVICYDPFSNAWWTESLADAITCGTKWVESNARNNYLFTTAGKSLQTESGNDHDDQPIEMEVDTHFYFPIAPEVAVNFSRFRIYTEEGMGIAIGYKLAYQDGKIDLDWRRPKVKYKTKWEQEVVVDTEDNKAAGFALKFRETSARGRPIIERIAAFYSGGDMR